MTGTIQIRGGRLIDTAEKLNRVANLWIADGQIAAIGDRPEGFGKPEQVIDAVGKVVCPGLIDLHCHLREPGQEEKETIETGARAAARGGFTTVVCMANTSPPIDTRAAVEYVVERARIASVRVLPVGTVTHGLKGEQLTEMADLADAGAVGFSDDGRAVANSRLMRHALDYSRISGLPTMEHCEDAALAQGGAMNEGWVATLLGVPGIPNAAEEIIAARDVLLAALTGGRVHIQHVSTAGTVEIVRRAKARGLPVTAEATPHHLTLTDEWVAGEMAAAGAEGYGLLAPASPEPYNTATKVNPPLRTRHDVEAVIAGLRDGTIDAIATDHAPHTVVDKECEYGVAAFGISGFETALGQVLTLVHRDLIDLPVLLDRLTRAPAEWLGRPELGTLRPGTPADVVVFDPTGEWTVDPTRFVSKGKNTPLAGVVLKGRVEWTLYGGRVVWTARSSEPTKAVRPS